MPSEVEEVCDRVGVISGGQLLTEATVAELRGTTTLVVRADPLDVALAVSTRLAGDDAVVLDGDRLRLDVDPSLAAPLVRELVGAGVDVHEVAASERSLEDVFFELTADHLTTTQPEEALR
jgi:ABC-2 type transport system ATP-binding protein